jgi:hypothetical protein
MSAIKSLHTHGHYRQGGSEWCERGSWDGWNSIAKYSCLCAIVALWSWALYRTRVTQVSCQVLQYHQDNQSAIVCDEHIGETIEQYFTNHPLRTHYFLVSETNLCQYLLQRVGETSSCSLLKKWPSTLQLTLEQQAPLLQVFSQGTLMCSDTTGRRMSRCAVSVTPEMRITVPDAFAQQPDVRMLTIARLLARIKQSHLPARGLEWVNQATVLIALQNDQEHQTITQVIMSPDETQLEVQLARLEVLLSNFQTGGAQLSGTWIADVRFERPVLKPM